MNIMFYRNLVSIWTNFHHRKLELNFLFPLNFFYFKRNLYWKSIEHLVISNFSPSMISIALLFLHGYQYQVSNELKFSEPTNFSWNIVPTQKTRLVNCLKVSSRLSSTSQSLGELLISLLLIIIICNYSAMKEFILSEEKNRINWLKFKWHFTFPHNHVLGHDLN